MEDVLTGRREGNEGKEGQAKKREGIRVKKKKGKIDEGRINRR